MWNDRELMCKRLGAAGLGLMLLLGTGPLSTPGEAQNQEQQEESSETAPQGEGGEQQPAESQDNEKAEVDAEAESRVPSRPAERFDPTEEISEDLSVSFPVDI